MLAAAAATPILPVSGQKLFYESFDSVPLGPNPEEASKGDKVWTRTPPTGWSVDDSKMPGYGTPEYAANDGRTEWAGWAFADVKWWPTVDDQRRSTFSLASGAAAIADPDEWDDATHLKGLFNAYMSSPSINVAGKAANTLVLTFDSSWRPEGRDDGGANWPVDDQGNPINNQTAVITAQWDNGAPVEVMRWDSISDSPYFKEDINPPNESALVELKNPGNAQKLTLKFGLLEAANDWWWAIDNVAVGEPPMLTGVSATGVGFTLRLSEALGKTVNDNAAITAKLDGQTVTVTDTRDGDKVLVAHDQSPKIFVPGSKHSVEVTFTTGAGKQVVDTADFVAPSYASVASTPNSVTISLSEKDYLAIDEAKGIKVDLDGSAVTPALVQRVDLTNSDGTDAPDRIDVRLTVATPFASASSHTLKVSFTTKTAQEVVENLTFKAAEYVTLAPSLATALGTGAQAGMKWRTHQLPTSRADSIAATEQQLAGQLGASEHDPSGQVAGGYFEINVVNFDQNLGEAGNFRASGENELAVADEAIPGIPGINSGTDEVAGEALAYVEIPQAGVYTMVVNSDDGFQVSVGNAANPTFQILGKFDAGRGQADTSFFFRVENPGVYLFRLLYFEGGGDARVEWFTVNANGTRALVNGTQTGALKAFRTRTVAEPPLPSAVDYSIGLNFGADEASGNKAGTLAATDKAGVPAVAQANWNNLSLNVGTNSAIVADVNGTAQATTVTVTWSSANTWSNTGRGEENNGLTGPDKALMLGYLDTGNATTTKVSIASIPAKLTDKGYDVYVYALGGVGGRGGSFRILDATTGAVIRDSIRVQSPTNAAAYIQADANLGASGNGAGTLLFSAANYMVFKGLTAANIIVEARTAAAGGGVGFSGTPRAPINAIQLVTPSAGPVIDDVTVPMDAIAVTSPTSRSPDAERVPNAIDNNILTKFLDFNTPSGVSSTPFKGPVGFTVKSSAGGSVVTGLALTSANDAPERDPVDYKLEGSNDGTTFTLISEGAVPAFAKRFTRQVISFSNTAAYTTYRFTVANVANNATANSMQIAEVEFLGTVTIPTPKITGLTKNADGSLTLEWTGGGTLQAAPAVTGPWQDVAGATSPYKLSPSEAAMFGRIKK